MIEVARRYGAHRGIENVRFLVMDAEAIASMTTQWTECCARAATC
jgi:hypothetical protein